MAVGFVIFGLTWMGVTAAAVVAMVVLTAGEILYKTTATAHVLDAAPAHLVGQYQGLYTGAATSGTMLSAPLGGMVYAARPVCCGRSVASWPAWEPCSPSRRDDRPETLSRRRRSDGVCHRGLPPHRRSHRSCGLPGAGGRPAATAAGETAAAGEARRAR